MKTYAPKPRDIERRWYVVDANDVVLGRLASEVAAILKGKHKPIYAPHADTGDHVVVINAGGIRLTGGKETKKIAYRHSGHPGGLTETRYDRLLDERPAFVVQKAVKGMLPKNSLGRSMLRKLQVYEGAEHPHAAQQPKPLAVGEVPRWDGLPAPAAEEARPKAKSPARKPATAKRAGAKPAAKKSAAKTTKKATAKKSTEKSTKKATAKKSAAKKPTAKKSAAKSSTAKSSTAGASKPRLRRTKKEGEDA
jgi:large subunit ribosomal protein L13